MSVVELTGSKGGERSRGELASQRVFLQEGASNFLGAIMDPGLPLEGDPFPGAPQLRASDFSAEPIDDGVNHWQVVVGYEGSAVQPGGGANTGFPTALISIQRGIQLVDTWRVGSSDSPLKFPGGITTPKQSDPTGTADFANGDIGGVKVDQAGNPVSLPHAVHRIQISYTLDGPPNEYAIYNLQGKRNHARWRVYPAGSVLYEGANTEQEGRATKIVHNFVADDLFHLRQHAAASGDGIDGLSGGGSEGGYTSRFVNWWQPFPLVGPFNILTPGGLSYTWGFGGIGPGGFDLGAF